MDSLKVSEARGGKWVQSPDPDPDLVQSSSVQFIAIIEEAFDSSGCFFWWKLGGWIGDMKEEKEEEEDEKKRGKEENK